MRRLDKTLSAGLILQFTEMKVHQPFFWLMIGTKIAVWLIESISHNQETQHVINVLSRDSAEDVEFFLFRSLDNILFFPLLYEYSLLLMDQFFTGGFQLESRVPVAETQIRGAADGICFCVVKDSPSSPDEEKVAAGGHSAASAG